MSSFCSQRDLGIEMIFFEITNWSCQQRSTKPKNATTNYSEKWVLQTQTTRLTRRKRSIFANVSFTCWANTTNP